MQENLIKVMYQSHGQKYSTFAISFRMSSFIGSGVCADIGAEYSLINSCTIRQNTRIISTTMSGEMGVICFQLLPFKLSILSLIIEVVNTT